MLCILVSIIYKIEYKSSFTLACFLLELLQHLDHHHYMTISSSGSESSSLEKFTFAYFSSIINILVCVTKYPTHFLQVGSIWHLSALFEKLKMLMWEERVKSVICRAMCRNYDQFSLFWLHPSFYCLRLKTYFLYRTKQTDQVGFFLSYVFVYYSYCKLPEWPALSLWLDFIS